MDGSGPRYRISPQQGADSWTVLVMVEEGKVFLTGVSCPACSRVSAWKCSALSWLGVDLWCLMCQVASDTFCMWAQEAGVWGVLRGLSEGRNR